MSDSAREAALTALERCRRSGAWSSATIDSVITKYGLDGRSAALATHICLGVLQNMTLCDFYIDSYCNSSAKIEPKVRDILRTAVYQLAFMDKIPANAAVNEAVSLCKKLGYSRASGFVNAVLRKISANINNLPEVPNKGTADYLAVRYSHPKWLAEYMINAHGYDFAESFFDANNREPYTAIQVNTLKISTDALRAKLENSGVECKAHPWLLDCLLVSGNITAMYGFADGLFYVQDPAARTAISIAEFKPGMKVLDACSAPGGKSFAAAIDMQNRGSILSCDLHEKKTNLIASGAERLGISIITTKAADARVKLDDEYDIIIADVPCSGYGVIRKKPDIRYKSEAERAGLPQIQSAILENLSSAVKRGGLLVYSTCTVFSEENGKIVADFLEKHSEYTAESFKLPNGKLAEDGMYTFWPHIDGTDGFFVCKLRRN